MFDDNETMHHRNNADTFPFIQFIGLMFIGFNRSPTQNLIILPVDIPKIVWLYVYSIQQQPQKTASWDICTKRSKRKSNFDNLSSNFLIRWRKFYYRMEIKRNHWEYSRTNSYRRWQRKNTNNNRKRKMKVGWETIELTLFKASISFIPTCCHQSINIRILFDTRRTDFKGNRRNSDEQNRRVCERK